MSYGLIISSMINDSEHIFMFVVQLYISFLEVSVQIYYQIGYFPIIKL